MTENDGKCNTYAESIRTNVHLVIIYRQLLGTKRLSVTFFILAGLTYSMNMKQKQSGRFAAAEELKIYFNTSGIFLKLLVCLVAILTILIIGCDLYAGYTSEEEPNDLPETANEFQGTNISWTGKIENATDQDWYRVYLSAGNTYRFTLNNLQNDLNLMLYTSDINNIGNSDRNELLDEVIEYAVPTTSFYYVLVEGSVNATDDYLGKYVMNMSVVE